MRFSVLHPVSEEMNIMSLRVSTTEKVTQELLVRVITALSSASGSLSSAQIHDLVTEQLTLQREFHYATNNDFGMCVERLLAGCELNGITDATSLETQYGALCAQDPVISELMFDMADGISKQLTTPLYDIRVTLPQAAKTMSAAILAKLPTVNVPGQPPELQHFSWGKMASESVCNSAKLIANTRLNCFKRPNPQSYDTDKILQALPFGNCQSVPGATEIQSKLSTALRDMMSPNTTYPTGINNFVAELIISPAAFRRWSLNARAILSDKKIGASVISITNQIDAIEDLLLLVDATLLTKISADSPEISSSILNNMEVVSDSIQLMRASMLYHKEVGLADRLLLIPNTVQESVMTKFVAEGGTEAMIGDYLSYIQLNSHLVFPLKGLSEKMIRDIHPQASKLVAEKLEHLNGIVVTKRSVNLQNTLSHDLDQHHETMTRRDNSLEVASNEIHTNQRQRALASLAKKPLEDVALEYLVAMRKNPLIAPLHKSISAELLALIGRDAEITKAGVAWATCSAVTKTLLTMLTTKFAVPAAA